MVSQCKYTHLVVVSVQLTNLFIYSFSWHLPSTHDGPSVCSMPVLIKFNVHMNHLGCCYGTDSVM